MMERCKNCIHCNVCNIDRKNAVEELGMCFDFLDDATDGELIDALQDTLASWQKSCGELQDMLYDKEQEISYLNSMVDNLRDDIRELSTKNRILNKEVVELVNNSATSEIRAEIEVARKIIREVELSSSLYQGPDGLRLVISASKFIELKKKYKVEVGNQ